MSGCAYVEHKFSLPCGMAHEDDICTVSQDWELPINGMIIVASKRHITVLEEMTIQERNHIFEIVKDIILSKRSIYLFTKRYL